MSHPLTTLATGGAYFEAPRWHDGRWWTSDLYRRGIFAYTPEGVGEQIVSLEDQPSGLGFLPDGSLIFVSQEKRTIFRRALDGTVSVHADLNSDTDTDLNDMVVDENGRAYVGTYGFDPFDDSRPPAPGVVIRIDPDGTHAVAAKDLVFPNGMVISPDGRLVVGEGLAGIYTSFAIGSDGELSDRRAFATMSKPVSMASMVDLMTTADTIFDGCTVDAEGAIWAADVKGARCIRILDGGQVTDEIPAPEGQNIFACMLGGEDGRTLLLCVAPGLRDNDRLGNLAATLQTTRVDVPHGGRP
jgi:sugar lactone lactonase YvrE